VGRASSCGGTRGPFSGGFLRSLADVKHSSVPFKLRAGGRFGRGATRWEGTKEGEQAVGSARVSGANAAINLAGAPLSLMAVGDGPRSKPRVWFYLFTRSRTAGRAREGGKASMAGGKARSVGLGGGVREGASLFYAHRRDCSRDMFSRNDFLEISIRFPC
jgi:hypothetical protein